MLEFACERCGHVGRANHKMPTGATIAFWIAIVVGLFTFGIGLLVALIIWAAGRTDHCIKCNATTLIPANSPRGQKLAREAESAMGPIDKPTGRLFVCFKCRNLSADGGRCQHCNHTVLARDDSTKGRELLGR